MFRLTIDNVDKQTANAISHIATKAGAHVVLSDEKKSKKVQKERPAQMLFDLIDDMKKKYHATSAKTKGK